ncbi:hypothetical protein M1446_01340 [Candidatus Dependentiae bacterium]|nr:hypothetical protein [Candidatus Dependentiae bacterium]
MNYKLFIFSLLFCSNLSADWLDDFAIEMSKKGIWDSKLAIQIIDKHIYEDEKGIQEIQAKINQQKTDGIWASLHFGAYKVELKTMESHKKYHEKVKKEIAEFNENKKEREKFFENLKELNQKFNELENLKNEYSNESEIYERMKIGAKITLKQSEITAKKIYIKSSFFLA